MNDIISMESFDSSSSSSGEEEREDRDMKDFHDFPSTQNVDEKLCDLSRSCSEAEKPGYKNLNIDRIDVAHLENIYRTEITREVKTSSEIFGSRTKPLYPTIECGQGDCIRELSEISVMEKTQCFRFSEEIEYSKPPRKSPSQGSPRGKTRKKVSPRKGETVTKVNQGDMNETELHSVGSQLAMSKDDKKYLLWSRKEKPRRRKEERNIKCFVKVQRNAGDEATPERKRYGSRLKANSPATELSVPRAKASWNDLFHHLPYRSRTSSAAARDDELEVFSENYSSAQEPVRPRMSFTSFESAGDPACTSEENDRGTIPRKRSLILASVKKEALEDPGVTSTLFKKAFNKVMGSSEDNSEINIWKSNLNSLRQPTWISKIEDAIAQPRQSSRTDSRRNKSREQIEPLSNDTLSSRSKKCTSKIDPSKENGSPEDQPEKDFTNRLSSFAEKVTPRKRVSISTDNAEKASNPNMKKCEISSSFSNPLLNDSKKCSFQYRFSPGQDKRFQAKKISKFFPFDRIDEEITQSILRIIAEYREFCKKDIKYELQAKRLDSKKIIKVSLRGKEFTFKTTVKKRQRSSSPSKHQSVSMPSLFVPAVEESRGSTSSEAPHRQMYKPDSELVGRIFKKCQLKATASQTSFQNEAAGERLFTCTMEGNKERQEEFHWTLQPSMDVHLCLVRPYRPLSEVSRIAAVKTWNRDISHYTSRLPVARRLEANTLVVFGGLDPARSCDYLLAGSVFAHNLETKEWLYGKTMPQPRLYHTATYLNGAIYIIGGYSLWERSCGELLASATTSRFQLDTMQWEPCADLLNARAGHAATALPAALLVVGGRARSGGFLNSAELYRPELDSWALVAPLDSPVMGLAAALTTPGEVVVLGGLKVRKEKPAVDWVRAYTLDKNEWRVLPSMTRPRAFCAAAVTDDGRVWALGGGTTCTPAQASTLVSLSDMEYLGPGDRHWTRCSTPLGVPRHAAAYCHHGTMLYLVGGMSSEKGGALATVTALRYDRGWVEEGTAKMPEALSGHAAVLLRPEIPHAGDTRDVEAPRRRSLQSPIVAAREPTFTAAEVWRPCPAKEPPVWDEVEGNKGGDICSRLKPPAGAGPVSGASTTCTRSSSSGQECEEDDKPLLILVFWKGSELDVSSPPSISPQ